jgi:hypothetical protein
VTLHRKILGLNVIADIPWTGHERPRASSRRSATPAIDALVAQFAVCPSPMSGLLLEHFHGAAIRVPAGETAFPQRREIYNLKRRIRNRSSGA